jgi:uncharacterized protein YwgA
VKVREVLLLMLDHAGGALQGRTLIQKRLFFLSLLMNLDLHYYSHYYGPFSPEVDKALGQCIALGLVEETIVGFTDESGGFEGRSFKYGLTSDGNVVVRLTRRHEPEISGDVAINLSNLDKAGHLDYLKLSIAAKALYDLRSKDKPVTLSGIIDEARSFDWDVPEPAVRDAVEFLKFFEFFAAESS